MKTTHPCLLLVAYTVAVVIGVTALVATEGPWVHEGEKPERSTACKLIPIVSWSADEARIEAAKLRAAAALIEGDLLKDARSQELRCAEDLEVLAAWNVGHFNWREGGAICFWIAVLIAPAWVFCARRRRVA